MRIKRLRAINFKRFRDSEFDFDEELNIIVGDNESGKSSLLEAIELSVNSQFRGRSVQQVLDSDLFNREAVREFLRSDKSWGQLPKITLEIEILGIPDYRGDNNTWGKDCEGISLKIIPNPELQEVYETLLSEGIQIESLPVEFYKVSWFGFDWNEIHYVSKKCHCLSVDSTKLHPTYGKHRYISEILDTQLSQGQRSVLNMNFRTLREKFDQLPEVQKINNSLDSSNVITDKALSITSNIKGNSRMEASLDLAMDSIKFSHVGKGEQNQIQIKLALDQRSKGADVVLIEEPENHLSHLNLTRLVDYIATTRVKQQVFVSTHSSFVLNKLNAGRLCLLSEEGYVRVSDVDARVVKRLKRLPGYDTLRIALAQKVILVEGPSDELVLKKIFRIKKGKLPEEAGVDVIVVRGVGFRNLLEFAKHLGTSTHVVRDNDRDISGRIAPLERQYASCANIRFFSSNDEDEYTLEKCMISANIADDDALDKYARIALSARTFKNYESKSGLVAKAKFLEDWFCGTDANQARKVDSAIRIFEKEDLEIEFPQYLTDAIEFESKIDGS